MKPTGPERLEVQHARTAPDGHAIEPEEQPARIVKPIAVPANLGNGPLDAGATPVGEMAGAITLDGTALGFARDLQVRCDLCKHFDRDAWRKLHARWTAPLASDLDKRSLADLRAAAIESVCGGNPDPSEVDRVFAECGICHPLTEDGNAPTIVIGSPWVPCNGSMFKARGVTEERESSAVFDRIMRMAQGRIA